MTTFFSTFASSTWRRAAICWGGIALACGIAAASPPLIPFAVPAIGFCFSVLAPANAPAFRFHRFLLPTVWLTAALVSYYHPGDEYGMFIIALLPAVWVQVFASKSGIGNLGDALVLLLAAGGIVMILCGWVLDRMRVHRKLWIGEAIFFATGFLIYGLSQFPSLHRATQKNGSLLAYQSASVLLGLYLATLLGFVATPVWRTVRPWLWRLGRRDALPPD